MPMVSRAHSGFSPAGQDAARLAFGEKCRQLEKPRRPGLSDFWRDPGPFTVAELASVCRVSPGLVRKMIATGSLRVRRTGRALRIPASEARRWALEAGAEPPAVGNLAHQAHHAHGEHTVKATVDAVRERRRTVKP
jgi:excisionase family DNA binding protein